MKQHTKKILWLVVGYTCLVLGVLGLFLPILQGFLFLAIGLVILSKHSVWAHRLKQRLERRFPKLGAQMRRGEARFRSWRMRWRRRGCRPDPKPERAAAPD